MAVHWQCFAIVAQIRMCYNVYAQNCIKCRQGKTDTIFQWCFFVALIGATAQAAPISRGGLIFFQGGTQ